VSEANLPEGVRNGHAHGLTIHLRGHIDGLTTCMGTSTGCTAVTGRGTETPLQWARPRADHPLAWAHRPTGLMHTVNSELRSPPIEERFVRSFVSRRSKDVRQMNGIRYILSEGLKKRELRRP
jgi:hypothetical protein